MPIRNSPRTVDVCPRTNFLRSDAGFADPVALCGISHPGNYECVPKFVTFCKLRAGISAEGREKRETSLRIPKDFPAEQFPRATAFAAARISNPHRGWPWEMVVPKPSRKKLK